MRCSSMLSSLVVVLCLQRTQLAPSFREHAVQLRFLNEHLTWSPLWQKRLHRQYKIVVQTTHEQDIQTRLLYIRQQ